MTKKNVAFVFDLLGVGGVEKALIEMLNAFDYEKYNVTLWLRNKSGEWTTQVNDNVTIRCWGDENSREIFNRQLKNKQYIAAAKSIYNKLKCRYWKNQWDMNEFYATKSLPKLNASYDCVIAYQVMSTAVVANVLYRLQSDKKILWVHGRNLRQPEKNLFWDKIYTQFDCIFCVSEACCRDFIFDFPKAGAKSQVFYNLLNKEEIERKADMQVEELRTEKDENVLVTVGRLEPIKGQMLIPEVAKMLEEDGYQFRWYLIGDGSMYGELEHRINELGVSDKVILLGSKDNPYPYIKGCDVYVQTSLNEGFGLTVAEAKILYKPIVTTDAGVMSEQILNGETGVIIEKAEPELLFENIKTMLDCPEVRACYIQNLQRVEYDTAKEMQKLYEFIED